MSNPRFDKFVETQIFTYYGCNVFKEIDYSNMEIKNDFEKLLREFKIEFGINYEFDNDKLILDYMEDNECIGKDNIMDFILFVKIILEKIYEIINNFKTFKKKNDVVLSKKEIKDRENEAKQMIKDQRRHEIEEAKQKERDEKRLKKEQLELERQQKKQIVKCVCGIEYVMFSKCNHLKSHDHILRLEGIRFFIKEHGLNFDI